MSVLVPKSRAVKSWSIIPKVDSTGVVLVGDGGRMPVQVPESRTIKSWSVNSKVDSTGEVFVGDEG